MVKRCGNWGQAGFIRSMFLGLMDEPLTEHHSMRQFFYREIPKIDSFVPEMVKRTSKWASNFYIKMSGYCSDLYLDGRVDYDIMKIYDDSGASELIYQNFVNMEIPPPEECTPEYPIEIWVENNATYNSLYPMFGWPYRDSPDYVKLNLVSGKGFVKTQQIAKFAKYRAEDVKLILYLTDFDPSGWCMGSHDLQNRLNQLGLDVGVAYIGIKPEQIPPERRITSIHTFKIKDSRSPSFIKEFGDKYPIVTEGYGYELQALTPPELRELAKSYLDKAIAVLERNGMI